MKENENDKMNIEEQIKLPKTDDNNNNSYKYHYNYYSPNYQKDINQKTYEFNYNNDLKQFNTSPKICHYHTNFKKLNNIIIPHHHCHLSREHKHIHSPQCQSNSSSPSPIKNISQPVYHYQTYYNSNLNYDNNLLYNNDKACNSQIFFSDELSNDFSNNNIALQKLNNINNESDNNMNNKNSGEKNHLNAMIFDFFMSKLVYNKYNKMKQFNESYYLRKQFGDETNYTNINNTFNDESIKDEFSTMRKNLEKKYKLYNLITKYDNIDLDNNTDDNLDNKEEDEEINNKKNKEKKNNKKSKIEKKRKKHKKNILPSSEEEEEEFDS